MLASRKTLERHLRRNGGRKVTVGGDVTWGAYDIADESAGVATLVGVPVIQVPTVVVEHLKEGEPLHVEGEGDFKLQYARRIGDGALTMIPLVED